MSLIFKKVSARNRLTNKHLEEEAFNKANNGVDLVPHKPIFQSKEVLSTPTDESLFLIGDLVWTKVRKTKAWPAMITFDPDMGIFFKEKSIKGGERKFIYQYHVQYFGDNALHGWVAKRSLHKFEGKDQHLPAFFAKSSNFSKKADFDSWSNALLQAVDALALNVNDRKLQYINNYFEAPREKTKVKKRSLSSADALSKEVKPQSNITDLKKEDLTPKNVPDSLVLNADITRYDDTTDIIQTSVLKSIKESINSKKKMRQSISSRIAVGSKELNLQTKKTEKNAVKPKVALKDTPINPVIIKVKDISGKPVKTENKDYVCKICEEVSNDLLHCSGECFNYFHADCLGLPTIPKDGFKCDECLVNLHTCFSCKQTGQLLKCSHSSCGKFYHAKCLENLPYTKFLTKNCEKFHCALHQCHSCYDATSLNNSSAKVLQCLRCPTAYHPKSCLVAGATQITNSFMICDKHFSPSKTKSHHSRVNVTWCFVCSHGGSLICCDNCPASFHLECIDDEDERPGEGETTWKCLDCKNNVRLKYHDLVWVKYSHFRWWPAQICYPSEIPEKIQNLQHDVGEFPVFFFGTKDYIWLPSHRCFKYQEGDTGGCKGKSSLAFHFAKALAEAKEEFQRLKEEKAEEAELMGKKKLSKPPPYGHIKANRPVTCIRNVLHSSEWPVCTCKPEKPCNSDSDCLNQLLYFECNPKTCPAKEKCQNQRMQKCEYVQCKTFKCEGRGWGLRAEQDIKSGDFVIEYVGELVDEETCYKRIQKYHQNDVSDYYFLTIDRDNIIDAYPKGNLSRFMNHSCDPNCVTQKWTVNGEMRVGLFAVQDINKGEELCFNYNLDCLGNEKKQCKCGSKNCSGFLGVRPKSQSGNSDGGKRKKKRKKKSKVVHDDDCFICTDGGELILCGRPNCPKSYHIKCLNLDQQPRGRWDCPYHFCDVCGKLSAQFCTICPNSFCKLHLEKEFRYVDQILVCAEHTDEDVKNYVEDSQRMRKSFNQENLRTVKEEEDSDNELYSLFDDGVHEESEKTIPKLPKIKSKGKSATPKSNNVEKQKVFSSSVCAETKAHTTPLENVKCVHSMNANVKKSNPGKENKEYNFSKLKVHEKGGNADTGEEKSSLVKIRKAKLDKSPLSRSKINVNGKRVKMRSDNQSSEKPRKKSKFSKS